MTGKHRAERGRNIVRFPRGVSQYHSEYFSGPAPRAKKLGRCLRVYSPCGFVFPRSGHREYLAISDGRPAKGAEAS